MSDVIATGSVESLPTWFEVLAMTINAMFGGAIARSRNTPIYGTVLAGVLVGLGGGMIRDMLLGLEPVAIADWYYLPAGIIGAVVGALCFHKIVVMDTIDLLINGFVLGFLVTIGAQKALEYNAPVLSAVALGVVTASMGGLVADVMTGNRATVAKQAHWVASSLVLGSIVFVFFTLTTTFWLATVLGVATTTFFRVLSQRRNWPSPHWPHETTASA